MNTNNGTIRGMIDDKTSDDVGLGNNDNVNIEEDGWHYKRQIRSLKWERKREHVVVESENRIWKVAKT